MKETRVTPVHTYEVRREHDSLPLMSSHPQAGFPVPGDDHIEKQLNIHDLLVKNPAATFFVRVEGDSMIGAGIFPHDVLVVDRSVTPLHGSIVVAALSGELVVKRIHRDRDTLTLVSENRAYPPLSVQEQDDCFVWGVVVGSVRVF